MPQLDKFAFYPSVFWLIVIFFSLYFVLIRYSFPYLYRLVMYRRRFVDFSLQSADGFVKRHELAVPTYSVADLSKIFLPSLWWFAFYKNSGLVTLRTKSSSFLRETLVRSLVFSVGNIIQARKATKAKVKSQKNTPIKTKKVKGEKKVK